MSAQLAHLEVRMTVIDKPTTRRRWNGDPMASEEASSALCEAVDAFRATAEARGFTVVRTGYGVTASEAPCASTCALCGQPIQDGQLYRPADGRSSWGGVAHVACPSLRAIEHAERMGRAA